ncbi:MAG: Sec-independent protein translocase protein TatB [Deinococcota bacterium]
MRVGPLGIWEMLIILVVVLLVFGPRRLPEMAKGMGQAVREFRKGIRDMKDEIEKEVSDDDSKKTVSQSASSQSSEKTEAKSA